MNDLPPVILASTSPHRRQLLDRLQLAYAAVAPQVEETDEPGEAPAARAVRLAQAKAAAVAMQHPGAIVIGSDQVASLETALGTTVLHKPGDRETCRQQLLAMSGQVVRFDTAVALRQGLALMTHLEPTVVRFRALSPGEIDRYMDREPAFDCAGGFKCEGLGVSLFHSVESRDPTALVGLPLIWLCEALRRSGVPV